MALCKSCGKKLNIFNTMPDFSGDKYCKECFNERKNKDKHMNQEGKTKEIRCKCKSCGKVWHYLENEAKRVNNQVLWGACGQMSCCLPLQLYSKNETGKWEQESDKFKKCPKCGSSNIKKTVVYYNEKT